MASFRNRNGRWQARVRRYDHPPVVKTFHSKADAKRWARLLETEMDQGIFAHISVAKRTTLSTIIDRYIKEVSPLKRGGKDEIIRLKAMKRHKMCKLTMSSLTPQAVATYRDDRLKTCAASTVIRDLGMLSSVINHSRREWGITFNNPVSQIRKPSMPKGRSRILSVNEEISLLSALEPIRNRNRYMKPLVILALETAMRRGELLSLEWQHIDFDRCVAFLPITKNGHSREVPLSKMAINTLHSIYKTDDKRVFPLNIAAMEANFMRARSRAGINDFHFHDLRHMATTRLAEKIPNILKLSAITGHKELRMLKRYYHPNPEALAKKLG